MTATFSIAAPSSAGIPSRALATSSSNCSTDMATMPKIMPTHWPPTGADDDRGIDSWCGTQLDWIGPDVLSSPLALEVDESPLSRSPSFTPFLNSWDALPSPRASLGSCDPPKRSTTTTTTTTINPSGPTILASIPMTTCLPFRGLHSNLSAVHLPSFPRTALRLESSRRLRAAEAPNLLRAWLATQTNGHRIQ